jgi:arylsulfatase A-like enzyme
MRIIIGPFLALSMLLVTGCGGHGSSPAGPTASDPPKNVIIVLVDALRADKLGCYGSNAGLTPEIDALAKTGLVFENAYSNATFTFPSTASLFTSTQPPVHRITHDPKREEMLRRLSDAYVMLPEVYKAAGYTTGLLTFPGWVSPTANYMQGVDVKAESERSDTDLLRLANGFVSDHAAEPFFLYVHFIDMHDYWFPEHLFEGANPEALGLSPSLLTLAGMEIPKAYETLAKVLNQPGGLTDRDLEYLQSVYDRRLRDTDRVIGELAAHLAAMGLTDDTLLVITADHGEQFLEHGRLVHGGDAFYNELIHIPFVVSNPRLFPETVTASTPMTSIDFAPTLLDLMGLEIPEVFQGESLVHRLDEDRVVFATDGRTWKAMNLEWSYIVAESLGREELYDLVADPGETTNVADQEPEIVALGRRLVKQAMAECSRHPYLALDVDEIVMPDEQKERLRSLGYIQ